ncbi:N-carbamoyl-L-amino-acid hydrolase [Nocardioides terrae]|uniref:N-carbamoyl-L-amino-acid hydrolase n=1 Tax=Nocardioides terrae TaxID=574651 RepID=A0A1I1HGY8_9ACTN|nr:allantoate amidohydrolase [Nocardioides terrae]SFC22842.1 N-carbamoyl-L-amino-acid hydrolase [Nocardioides terrae]
MTFERMWADLAPVGRAASGGYLRHPWTSPTAELEAWFEEAATARGLAVERDAFGNLLATTAPGPDRVLVGSHFDSVPDGGAYDGPLGVVSAFAALDVLEDRGFEPTRPIGIAAFQAEEGSRFGVACLGSRLATGSMPWESARELTGRDGVRLGDVVEGGDSDLLHGVSCFVELHVEQGRGLVDLDAPVGVASGIWPHGRWRFDFAGVADHAGATRMEDRHDPMLTYAVTALAANKQARLAGQRATFGRVEAVPNGTNAIPSHVTGWLDARAETEPALEHLVGLVSAQARERARLDGTSLTVTAESVSGSVSFDAPLAARIGRGRPVLPTQAGHDAGVLQAAGIPTAMLFVRNPTGVSHSPAEHAETADCLAGVEALADALQELA